MLQTILIFCFEISTRDLYMMLQFWCIWYSYHEGCFNATIVSEVDVLDIAIKPHTVASCYDECNQANLFALQVST